MLRKSRIAERCGNNACSNFPRGWLTADGVSTWSITTGAGLHRQSLMHRRWSFEALSWRNRSISLSAEASHFGYVHEGFTTLECASGRFDLQQGMYFSVPGAGRLEGCGCGVLTSQPAFHGLFQIGGPIERTGRLTYIDGCSDSLLIAPAIRGDACLNFLCLPPATTQTAHTHPSFRCGLVTSGAGICKTATAQLALSAGTGFAIDADAIHSFHTSDVGMRVIAFHPDSDFGPWHDDHPMVNRTMIDGQAASQMTLEARRVSRLQLQQERDREMP